MKRNWFWGIICILGAILIFGNLFGIIQFNLSLWKIAGTLICLSVIIDGIKERSFYSPLFGIAIIFYLFKEDLGFEDISLWLLLLATWLLAWGLTSIIHPKKRHIEIEDIEYSTNSIINVSASFGAKVQYIQTNDLQYVTIDSKFSGLKLYFDQATIQNRASILKTLQALNSMYLKNGMYKVMFVPFLVELMKKDSHHLVAILH